MNVSELELADEYKDYIMKKLHVYTLYDVQERAVQAIFGDKNLVVSVPTASGKSLIGYIAMFKELQETNKVLYIAPFKAIAVEKYRDLQDLKDLGISVALGTGDYQITSKRLLKADIKITTLEKADSMLIKNIAFAEDISLIVIDELHFLGDKERGATMEAFLTKLLTINPNIQIVGLSATIPNYQQIADWFNQFKPTEVIYSNKRRVPLKIGYFDGEVLNIDNKMIPVGHGKKGVDAVCRYIVNMGKQVIVFVATRRNAQSLAMLLSDELAKYSDFSQRLFINNVKSDFIASGKELTQTHEDLFECMAKGVAFHHAGLDIDTRIMIEDLFRAGKLNVIVATTTLCLHPDTKIITIDGIKKITELNANDYVLTHTGEFKRVIEPISRDFKGKLLKVHVHGTLPVLMTPEHRVLYTKRKRHGSHYADGTYRYWKEYSKPEWITIGELKNIVDKNRDKNVSYMLLQPVLKHIATIKEIKLRRKSTVKNQFGDSGVTHPQNFKTPEYLPLNYDTAKLIGAFVAEGSTTKTGAINFDIATYENKFTGFIASTIKKYFRYAKVVITDKDRHRRRVRFCNKRFAEWLKNNVGHNAHFKKIPDEIMYNTNSDVKIGFIDGYLWGDGYIHNQSSNSPNCASFATVSETLAYQLQMLLASIGIVSGISKTKRYDSLSKRGYTIIYEIRVSGKSLYKLLDMLGVKYNFKGNRTYNVNEIKDGYLLMRIKKIEEVEYEGKVYNLEVEGDRSYSAGFIVHNSMGINLPAFAVIVRDMSVLRMTEHGLRYVPIKVNDALQYVGRAGRPRYDSEGWGIFYIKRDSDKRVYSKIMRGELENIMSNLNNEKVLRRQILALVGMDLAGSIKDIMYIFSKSFYFVQGDNVDELKSTIVGDTELLQKMGFIKDIEGMFKLSNVAGWIVKTYIDPLTAYLYLYMIKYKSAYDYFSLLFAFGASPDAPDMIVKGQVNELMQIMNMHDVPLTQKEIGNYEKYLSGIKVASILWDWINETPLANIADKWNVQEGDLNNLRSNASWILASIKLIIENNMEFAEDKVLDKLNRLSFRVKYGVSEELVDLVKIRYVGRKRARALWNSGYKSIEDIANAEPIDLMVVRGIGKKLAEQLIDNAQKILKIQKE